MDQERRQQVFEAVHRLKGLGRWFPWPGGMLAGEFFVLGAVARAQTKNPRGLKSSQIGLHFEMSRPAVSQLLSSLEKKGLIERSVCEEDRRLVYVRILPEGLRQVNEYSRKAVVLMDEVFDQISDEEIDQLLHVTDHLYTAMRRVQEAHAGEEGGRRDQHREHHERHRERHETRERMAFFDFSMNGDTPVPPEPSGELTNERGNEIHG